MYTLNNEDINYNFHRKLVATHVGEKVYEMTRITNIQWPDKATILKFCDDGHLSGEPCHFGGMIDVIDDNTRLVTLYVD